MSNFDDRVLIEKMLDSLPRSLRHGREWFLEGRVHRWVGTVNGLPAGRPMREPESRHLPEPVEHPDLFVVGDYLFDSTINGVLDSADIVADWILEEIEEEYQIELNSPAASQSTPSDSPLVPKAGEHSNGETVVVRAEAAAAVTSEASRHASRGQEVARPSVIRAPGIMEIAQEGHLFQAQQDDLACMGKG